MAERVDIYLMHYTGAETQAWGRTVTVHHKAHRMTIPRPADGREQIRVECPECGQRVKVDVQSPRAMRRSRVLGTALVLIGCLAYLGACEGIAAYGAAENPLDKGLFISAGIGGVVVAAFMGTIFARKTATKPGVSVNNDPNDPLGPGLHQVALVSQVRSKP